MNFLKLIIPLFFSVLLTLSSYSQTDICDNTPGGELTVSPFCNPTTMNTDTDTDNDYWDGADGSCNSGDDDDKWAWFTATSNNTIIKYTSTNGKIPVLHLFESTPCSVTMTPVACKQGLFSGNTSATIVYATTPGTVYHVRVQIAWDNSLMTGTICITSLPSPPPCGLNYTHSTIAYNNDDYTDGSSVSFIDDSYAPTYTSIGFPFCFDGVIYNDVLISSNSYITFPNAHSQNASGLSTPNAYSDYTMTAGAAIPNTDQAPRNAILGVWQDIDPSVSGTVRTKVHGTAPNRRFVLKFENIAMYDCNADKYQGQIMLYETTNNIEVHIGEKTICSSGWNNKGAILGLHDYSGTVAVVAPGGYNYPTQWAVASASPEAHLFTSNCGSCVPLPVELLDFNGERIDGETQLNWTTLTEINNDYFVIEKSEELGVFYEIGKIEGAGNSNSNLNYKYIDKEFTSEVVYYRLRQVDFDGKTSYSKIIAIKHESIIQIQIYPNPANNELMINGVSSGDNIQLFNLFGTMVFEQKANNKSEVILLDRFPEGTYIIKIIGKDKLITEKLSIKH